METKAYFMVKMDRGAGGDGYVEAIRELEAMPEVEAVESVSGEYDLVVVAAVDAPIRVAPVANKIQAKKWVKDFHILKVESAAPNPFLDEVCSIPGGECVLWCVQCSMCSASCPNVAKMDYSPRKIIALIRAGRRYDVLTSNSMWVCASCYLCTARCPRDVKPTELMHALERLAIRHGLRSRETSTPAMYRVFVDSIKSNGRIFEMGMMMKFYLSTLLTKSYLLAVLTRKTNPLALIKMLPLALKLFTHGRMSIKPRKINCSQVCCMYSMKFGHLIREHLPGAKVYEFYIDLRAVGKAFEEFYNRVLDEGTMFVRGRPSDVVQENGRLLIQCEDTLADCQRHIPVDMAILSTALEPKPDAEDVARLFSLSRSHDGFFLERHPKLDPVATMNDGIFVVGCCQSPKDIPQSVAQASAAAARVLAMISAGAIEIEATTAAIDEELCSGCKICSDLCPFHAISFDEERRVCQVNEALCKSCGVCVAACPSGAITGKHFTTEQIMAEIEGVLV